MTRADPNIEVGCGASTLDRPFEAGVEAAKASMAPIKRHALSAILVFISRRYEIEAVLRGIRSVVVGAPLFGATTTDGEICDGLRRHTVTVAALASPYLRVQGAVGRNLSQDWRGAVDELTAAPELARVSRSPEASWQTRVEDGASSFLMLIAPGAARPGPSRTFEILEAIQGRVTGECAIVGGAASHEGKSDGSNVLLGDRIYSDSVLAVVFETTLRFGIALAHGLRPTPLETTVTAVENHELLTLDGLPAAQMLPRLLGLSRNAIEGQQLTLATGNAVGTQDVLAQYRNIVVGAITPRGGVLLDRPVAVGTTLTLMKPDRRSMATAGCEALRKSILRGAIAEPAVAVVNYSALRPNIMGHEATRREFSGMTELLGGAPVVGLASFGEVGLSDHGESRYDELAISALVIGQELSDVARLAMETKSVRQSLARQLAERTRMTARSESICKAAIASAAELLRSLDPDRSIPKVLRLVGTASEVSRIQIYENEPSPDGRVYSARRYGWDAPGIIPAAEIGDLSRVEVAAAGPNRLVPFLSHGEPQTLFTRETEDPLRALLRSLGVLSALFVPIMIDGRWWGQLEIDDCGSERVWSTSEIETFKVLAELVGTAIVHPRDLRELTAAGRIIENSGTVLYRLEPRAPFGTTYASRNVARYGYNQDDILRSPTRYFDLIHPDDLADVMSDIVRISEGRSAEASGELRMRLPDGTYIWAENRLHAIRNGDGRLTAIEGILIDISERKSVEARLMHFARTDQLTGLASRKAFMEQLAETFAAARRGAAGFSVLYLDIDHFKDVNDVLGHTKGDELLKAVAGRLRSVVSPGSFVARVGGDEFAILLGDVTDPSVAGALGAKIIRTLASTYNIGSDVHITASVGISVYGHDMENPEEMMKQADLALYRAKDSGRNQYHFHSEDLDIEVRERVTLAEELRLALDRNELEIYYQPQVEVISGRVIGLEALARWNHPTRGLLLPSRFIPVAEKTGIILSLGRWVIDEVLRQLRLWRADGVPSVVIAINLSAAQLNVSPDFDQEINQQLRKWGIEPAAIEFELTESVLMATTREHGDIIERLCRLGVSIAIDDFGTGYSSLEYLRAYRVTRLKIAQEFIRDLEADSGDAAIVRAAISLARELEIKAIAEGVETQSQFELLVRSGCQYVQGYCFSPPVSSAQAAEILRRGRLAPAWEMRSEPPAAQGTNSLRGMTAQLGGGRS